MRSCRALALACALRSFWAAARRSSSCWRASAASTCCARRVPHDRAPLVSMDARKRSKFDACGPRRAVGICASAGPRRFRNVSSVPGTAMGFSGTKSGCGSEPAMGAPSTEKRPGAGAVESAASVSMRRRIRSSSGSASSGTHSCGRICRGMRGAVRPRPESSPVSNGSSEAAP